MTSLSRRTPAIDSSFARLTDQLWDNFDEIEQTVAARIDAIRDPSHSGEEEYLIGLRAAVPVAINFSLNALKGKGATHPVPASLLVQARVAARHGVQLSLVLRRYMAGCSLLGDFIFRAAAEPPGVPPESLSLILNSHMQVFDRLVSAIADEYGRESELQSTPGANRQVTLVQDLLAGKPTGNVDLDYDVHSNHVGIVAEGTEASGEIRRLARKLDARTLIVEQAGGIFWAWLGSSRRIQREELRGAAQATWLSCLPLSMGEPANGLCGWRLTHKQARAAFSLMPQASSSVLHYSDVALLISASKDGLLATSLRHLYLTPLSEERDGGQILKATLKAYFAAGRNSRAAASALGVSRRTVSNRLRAAEKRTGLQLHQVGTQFEAALQLDELIRPKGWASSCD